MACLTNSSPVRGALLLNGSAAAASTSSHQGSAPFSRNRHKRRAFSSFQVRAESPDSQLPEKNSRRNILLSGAIAANFLLLQANLPSFAAEAKKGFQAVSDNKDGYSILYPFGWQEVVVQGQDRVFKDVIEPLESVSVNVIKTSKQDVRELGSAQSVAETLIKKVLAPPSQTTKLIEASEHDVEGKTYYTFEFTAQAPNFTRHALGAISIANGKFYTVTTGANERRWDKMKDKLHTVIDSFQISDTR